MVENRGLNSKQLMHGRKRCGQANANSSPFARTRAASGHTELTPLTESGGVVGLKNFRAVEGALLIEQVVDWSCRVFVPPGMLV